MNLNRIIVVLVVLITGIFVATAASFAAKPDRCSPWPACKDDGDPPPPPTGCTDTFPGFLYEVEATRKAPAELHLASSDGCRSELVAILPNFRQSAMRMTADGSKGVIVWTEDINNQKIVQRLDFTVDNSGNLALLGQPVTILPLTGEEAPPGDSLSYSSVDIWGDATHDSLYMTVLRMRSFNSAPNAGGGTREALIYDLNDLTGNLAGPAPDERLLFHLSQIPGGENLYGDWLDADELDCSSVFFPQFVPTCYRPQTIRFNPSGTRLYIHDNINDTNGQRWDTALRIHIDKGDGGLPLDKWILSAPELVYAGTTEHEPGGMVARPGLGDPASELPSPEYIAMNYLDRSGNQTQVIGAIMDADLCAAYYAPHADGEDPAPASDFWKSCLGTSTFVAGNLHGGGDSWQSPDTLLKSTLGKRHYDIYRHDVTDGTEQLLIENARGADTGF